jgi:hypothetical protein
MQRIRFDKEAVEAAEFYVAGGGLPREIEHEA